PAPEEHPESAGDRSAVRGHHQQATIHILTGFANRRGHACAYMFLRFDADASGFLSRPPLREFTRVAFGNLGAGQALKEPETAFF
ncbi:hypothetical protein OJ930_11575, partial [Streptococcus anginosus]|nr:hypothetical protein [Streptococcus anginosus]